MKRILITGHTGMLGRNLVESLGKLEKYSLFGVSKSQRLNSQIIGEINLDMLDTQQVTLMLNAVRPDVIIHTAAFTNLQYCEKNRNEAFKLHVELTKTLAQYSTKLIYISTDSVFNGDEGNYKEDDLAYPLNYYALSKWQGEWAVTNPNPSNLVIRTNIYGFKEPLGNSLAEWALKSFQAGTSIAGFNDVMFNPLYVGQLSNLIIKCIDKNVIGTLHVGTSENMSKFAFLKAIATEFGFSEALISESASPNDHGLRRPKNTTLNIEKLSNILNERPSLMTGLKQFKSDYLRTYAII